MNRQQKRLVKLEFHNSKLCVAVVLTSFEKNQSLRDMAFLVAAGVFCADQTGVVNISNAVEGEDLATGRQLSTSERVVQGAIGGFSLVSTATGGLNMIRGAIRRTGQCQTVGKYFSNCCFISTTPVYVRREADEIAVEAEIDGALAEDDPNVEITVEPTVSEVTEPIEEIRSEQAGAPAPIVAASPVVVVNGDEGVNAIGEPLEYFIDEGDASNGGVQTVAGVLAGLGGVAFIVGAARARRKKSLREQVFFEYDDADGENVDLSDAFLLARTKRGLECDEKVNALETDDAPHESPTDVTTEAKIIETPVLQKKTERAKETNGAKKRMRRFNWLTITGAFLILLAAAIAWTPVGKIIPRQYSPRNIAVVDQSTATNVVEDVHEQVVDIENALPIADGIPWTVEVAENKEVISDAEPQPVTHEQEKELSVDEDATVGSEAASSPVATFESRTVSIHETSARRERMRKRSALLG